MNLSEVPSDADLLYTRNGFNVQMTTLNEVMSNPDEFEDCRIFIAKEHPASFSIDDFEWMMENEMDNQEQCDDWDSDMMRDIRESSEAKQFVEFLNRAARRNMTYVPGEEVDKSVMGSGIIRRIDELGRIVIPKKHS